MTPFVPWHNLLHGAILLLTALLVSVLVLRPTLPTLSFLQLYEIIVLGVLFGIMGLTEPQNK